MMFTSSTIIAILGFSTRVLSAAIPFALPPSSTVNVVNGEVSSAIALVQDDSSLIAAAVTKSASDVNGQVQLVLTLNADLADIINVLNSTAAAITASTASTANAATVLTQPEIDALAQTLQNLTTFVSALIPALQAANAKLSASTQIAIASEYQAVLNAIQSFVTPVTTYASSVTLAGSTTTGSGTSALTTLVNSLLSTISTLLGSLGISTPL